MSPESASVWWFLLTATLSSCSTALLVAAVLKRAFESSSVGKRMNSLEIEMADLRSSMQSLLESHKRLRSRIGMQELRERNSSGRTGRTADAPPPGASKQELRDFYLRGKSPREIAQLALNGSDET